MSMLNSAVTAASSYVTPENVFRAGKNIYRCSMFAAEGYALYNRYFGRDQNLRENDTPAEILRPTPEHPDPEEGQTIRRSQEQLERERKKSVVNVQEQRVSVGEIETKDVYPNSDRGREGKGKSTFRQPDEPVSVKKTKRKRRSLNSEDMIRESPERIGPPKLMKQPTADQVAMAKIKIQYDEKRCHFAVYGAKEAGKSSFINAVRGISKRHEAASTTTTSKAMSRHPDPRTDPPFCRFVWYELPRTNKSSIHDSWEYFTDQGLFVFDFVVIIYDTSFSDTDARILEYCMRFNIPSFVVRSKADQHIRRSIKKDEKQVNDRKYHQARYVEKTRTDFRKSLEQFATKRKEEGGKLDPTFLKQKLYIVSKDMLSTKFGTDVGEGKKKKKLTKEKIGEIIDEEVLLGDMLDMATKRRTGGKQADEKKKKFWGIV